MDTLLVWLQCPGHSRLALLEAAADLLEHAVDFVGVARLLHLFKQLGQVAVVGIVREKIRLFITTLSLGSAG